MVELAYSGTRLYFALVQIDEPVGTTADNQVEIVIVDDRIQSYPVPPILLYFLISLLLISELPKLDCRIQTARENRFTRLLMGSGRIRDAEVGNSILVRI